MAKAAMLTALGLCVACVGPSQDADSVSPIDAAKGRRAEANTTWLGGWPPAVVGVEGNRVAISAGSRDGVRVGDRFALGRRDRHVGSVTIDVVYGDIAGGVFGTDCAGDAAPPQVGDRATYSPSLPGGP
jgi:hypothetical protein